MASSEKAISVPKEGPIRLTFLSTGSVRIRPSMLSQPADKWTILRRLCSLSDREWTQPLPVGVFIIHHPEGIFLFDTGQSPCCNDAGHAPWASFLSNFLAEFTISEEDSVVKLLAKQGIKPSDLKAIVLSHLHGDHAGGLEDLVSEAPDVPIYVSQEHWKAFGEHPLLASFQGASPNNWPKNFSPRIINFEDKAIGPWKQSYPLTADGSIVVVDTSGHVPGHISLIIKGQTAEHKPATYFLPGDATYGIAPLNREEPDGINDDPLRALQSLKLIKEYARQTDVVILPSHDPDTPKLLAESVVFREARP